MCMAFIRIMRFLHCMVNCIKHTSLKWVSLGTCICVITEWSILHTVADTTDPSWYRSDCKSCRHFDSQNKQKNTLFGSSLVCLGEQVSVSTSPFHFVKNLVESLLFIWYEDKMIEKKIVSYYWILFHKSQKEYQTLSIPVLHLLSAKTMYPLINISWEGNTDEI